MGKFQNVILCLTLITISFAVMFSTKEAEAVAACPDEYDQCVLPIRDAFIDENAYYEFGEDEGDLLVGYDSNNQTNGSISFLKFQIPYDQLVLSDIEQVELGMYVPYMKGTPQFSVSGITEDDFWPEATDRSDQEIISDHKTTFVGTADTTGFSRGGWLVVDVTDYVKAEMTAAENENVTFMLEGQPTDGEVYFLFEDIVDEHGELDEDAGNGSQLFFSYKDTGPPTGTLSINGGDMLTSDPEVTLDVSATDEEGSYPIVMRFRNESSDYWSPWQEWSSAVDWKLSDGDGKKTVYMELKDAAGNDNRILIYSDIILDTAPPVISGVRDGDVVKTSVTPEFNEGEGTLNGTPFMSGGTVSDEGKYTLTVTDDAGNTVTVSFEIDKSNPIATEFVIEDGATTVTEQTVTLSVYADEPLSELEMRFKNEDSDWEDWEPAVPERTGWKLSEGDGIKTVSMQLRDERGNVSNILKDSVRVGEKELSARLTINDGEFYTDRTRVTLSIEVEGYLSNYDMRFSHDDKNWYDRDWETARSTKQWTLRTTNGVQMVYMQVRDEVGNIYTDNALVILDTRRPTGTLKIEDGKTSVSSNDVVLHLTYDDESPLEVRFSNDSSSIWSSWERVKEEMDWTLSSGNGQKTVRMQLRDAAGNVSSVIRDTISVADSNESDHYEAPTTWEPVYDFNAYEDEQNDVQNVDACGLDWEEPPSETLILVQDEADRLGVQFEMAKEVTLSAEGEEENVHAYETVKLDVENPETAYAAILQADGTFLPVPVQTDGNCIEVKLMDSATVILFRNQSSFEDVIDHWAEAKIEEMADRLILTGTGKDLYEPDRPVTRAEFATALVRSLGLPTIQSEQHFTDVPEQSWAFPYIETAYAHDLIAGYNDQTFKPNQTINRQEAAVILFNAMALTDLDTELILEVDEWLFLYQDQENISEWARDAIALNIQYGIMQGDNKEQLLPQDELTRAQMAVMLAGYMEL